MPISRRQLFGSLARMVQGRRSVPSRRRSGLLRPPGAIPEARFLVTCERCSHCLEACEPGAIRRLGEEYGEAAGTPVIDPEDVPCTLCEDPPCAAACPSGALEPLVREKARMGLAVLERTRCLLAEGQPCDYCAVRCPLGEVAIRLGDAGPVIDPVGCTGCGVCAHICPTHALRIRPWPDRTPAPPARR